MHLYVQHATASGGSTILEAGRTRDWDAARHGHALGGEHTRGGGMHAQAATNENAGDF